MNLLLCLLTAILMTAAAFGQTTASIQEITYQAFTRGYRETIRISPDSLIREEEGVRGNTSIHTAISRGEWSLLLESLQGISLEKVGQLPAPTNKRQRDAALHATLSIRTAAGTYTSTTFDHMAPPKALEPLVQHMHRLSKKD
jgi:hypothetical protein